MKITFCIIYGPLSTEISFQYNEDKEFNYSFNHCLIKLDPTIDTDNEYYENTIINQSPEFTDNTEGNFHLAGESPAINAGETTFILYDIEGNSRNNADIGAFEFIE